MPQDEPERGPPAHSSLEVSWNFLKDGVDRIMLHLEKGMSYSYYMLLYTACYNYCINTRHNEAMGYSASTSALGSAGTVKAGAHLMGSDLYNKLSDYLRTHLVHLRTESESLSDLALLQFYTREWNRYTTGANYVSRLFSYLNRHWVKREKDEGRKGIYQVYTLALVQWKEHFFLAMAKPATSESEATPNRLIQALLKQIENDRNGEQVDGGMIKSIIDSLVALGLEDESSYGSAAATGTSNNASTSTAKSPSSTASSPVYRDHFQKPFLQATETYYRAESEAFLADNSISDYLVLATRRLEQEERRVDLYMYYQTRGPLLARCEIALVKDHQARMQQEFTPLLLADRQEDLARMWKLLYRVGGLEPLRVVFQEHVAARGREAIDRAQEAVAQDQDDEPGQDSTTAAASSTNLDPKSYVSALLSVYRKNLDTVQVSFEGDTGFQAALDKACADYINTNSASPDSSKSSELVALYVDGLLKKTNKDSAATAGPSGSTSGGGGGGETMEQALEDAMTLFKYLTHKDVFQTFYAKRLAERLLRGSYASEEAEGSMISKLKDHCGYEYTSHLGKMLTDVGTSRELTDKFVESMAASGSDEKLEFSIIVGGSNNWPFNGKNTIPLQVPRELQPMLDRFKGYYNSKHSGRQLTWMWPYCKNEVQLQYTKPKITLMTSTYQFAILALFNSQDSISFGDIAKQTLLTPEGLRPIMQIFIKSKVLLCTGTGSDAVFSVNLGFKSKKIRLNLNVPIRAEVKRESVDSHKVALDNRKFIYQATIVRIMKSRKQLKHQLLINEVSSQVSKMFPPDVKQIKKAIEHLVDKEYLERAEGANDTYNYLA